MRSRDYSDPWETYTPLEMSHMVRAALISGIRRDRGYSPNERLRYKEILRAYSRMGQRLESMYDLLQVKNPTKKQQSYLDDLLEEADPKSSSWAPFDYRHLMQKGVIIQHEGNAQDLITLMKELPENKVVFTNADLTRGSVDYLKHVKPRQKISLNSKEVIRTFAEDRGFELPEPYLRKGRLTEEVYKLLEEQRFTFVEALKSSIRLLKENYRERDISVFVVSRRNGDEVRLFPYDFLVKGTELFYEVKQQNRLISMEHGKVTKGEFKYHGTNIFKIPRMFPSREKRFDEVEVAYLAPVFGRPKDMTLEWFSTITRCNCDWSLNTRNFEIRRGRMTRQATTFDVHARVMLLYVASEYNQTKERLIIYPAPEFVKLVDKFRFNLCKDDKFIGQMGVNRLIIEAFKQLDFEEIVSYHPPEESQILRPI